VPTATAPTVACRPGEERSVVPAALVLMVDDDEAIRDVAVLALRVEGDAAVAMADAAAAADMAGPAAGGPAPARGERPARGVAMLGYPATP